MTEGVQLVLEVGTELGTVSGNEKAIETVMMNLLLNAVQATPAGGSVRASVLGSPGRPLVRLVVEDTGPGIPSSIRNRVFEPFFTGKDGTGLGLTVCRTIMDRHGGRLWIDDSYVGGTRFVADFPVER